MKFIPKTKGQWAILLGEVPAMVILFFNGLATATNFHFGHWVYAISLLAVGGLLIGVIATRSYWYAERIDNQTKMIDLLKQQLASMENILAYGVGLLTLIERGYQPDTSEWRRMIAVLGLKVDVDIHVPTSQKPN
jgi:hypothetical protein